MLASVRMSTFSLEQQFEILRQGDEVQRRPIVLHIDQQIEIAVDPILAAGDGTEHAHVPSAVVRGETKDFVALPVNGHDSFLSNCTAAYRQ
jgi:hypothetical protein